MNPLFKKSEKTLLYQSLQQELISHEHNLKLLKIQLKSTKNKEKRKETLDSISRLESQVKDGKLKLLKLTEKSSLE